MPQGFELLFLLNTSVPYMGGGGLTKFADVPCLLMTSSFPRRGISEQVGYLRHFYIAGVEPERAI